VDLFKKIAGTSPLPPRQIFHYSYPTIELSILHYSYPATYFSQPLLLVNKRFAPAPYPIVQNPAGV
jgi:hypothetical protein